MKTTNEHDKLKLTLVSQNRTAVKSKAIRVYIGRLKKGGARDSLNDTMLLNRIGRIVDFVDATDDLMDHMLLEQELDDAISRLDE